MATGKKSLASIYAKAGSGVFNYVNCCFSLRGDSSIFGSHLPLRSWLLKVVGFFFLLSVSLRLCTCLLSVGRPAACACFCTCVSELILSLGHVSKVLLDCLLMEENVGR